MRQERFKMEREGLVEEGQEVEISERSAVTGQYTYLVEPSVLSDRGGGRIAFGSDSFPSLTPPGKDYIINKKEDMTTERIIIYDDCKK